MTNCALVSVHFSASFSRAKDSVRRFASRVFSASDCFRGRVSPVSLSTGGPLADGVFIVRFSGLDQIFGELSVPFQIRDAAGGAEHPADLAYESPFIACLESARIRLKEGSRPSVVNSLGGQSPFRGLDAPLALLFSYHNDGSDDNTGLEPSPWRLAFIYADSDMSFSVPHFIRFWMPHFSLTLSEARF